MAASLPPGIGNPQQASQATAFMRQQPWYAQLVRSWGFDPTKTDSNGNLVDPRTGQSVKLSDPQQQQLIATARDNGIGISNSYNIDENGQIAKPDSHMLRNIAIAAGITGLALTGLGAAGIGPMSGLFGAGAGGAAAADGAIPAAFGTTAVDTVASAAPAVAGGVGSAIGTGAKLASLASSLGKFGSSLSPNNVGGPGSTSPRGSAYAAEAAQLAANRAAQAKIDQSGPAADTQAFKNQMRAALVARMDPNAAPVNLNGTALPSLVTPESVAAASRLRDTLAQRVAAGKTPTTFGVSDPTQQELDAQNKALDAAGIGSGLNSDLATAGDYLQTGARLANLGINGWNLGKNIVSAF